MKDYKPSVILLLLIFLTTLTPVAAQTSQEHIEFDYIYSSSCPYCTQQEAFHKELLEQYPNIQINQISINNPNIQTRIQELETKHNVEVTRIGTPMTFVEGELFLGFSPVIANNIQSTVETSLGLENTTPQDSDKAYLPYIGEVSLSAFSLPVLAMTMGFVDGLNVCSIGALLLILGIVVHFKSRRKIFLYGGLFIFTTVAVYGTIIFAWYHILERLLAYFNIINYIIGLAGLLGGAYFFKEFLQFYKHGPTCQTTGSKFVQRVRKKVHNTLHDEKSGFIAIAGAIILFAAGMTIVELPCSVALPLVFTGVLADANLTTFAYISYIGLYLLMYMLIELIIFSVAVYTKDLWYGPNQAVTWTTLVAAIILILLGLYYLPLIPFGM